MVVSFIEGDWNFFIRFVVKACLKLWNRIVILESAGFNFGEAQFDRDFCTWVGMIRTPT